MNQRAIQKLETRNRLLDAASKRLRSEGLTGSSVASVMKDAGLTHGGFYSHFSDKDELTREAFIHSLARNRESWMNQEAGESWKQRLNRLAKRYLTPKHRDNLDTSCPFAALGTEAARSKPEFKTVFEQELTKSLSRLCEEDFTQLEHSKGDEALAYLSMLVGALILSRAVSSEDLSGRILTAVADRSSMLVSEN
ncbi:HTH-type transcriptional regulator AcrR [Marinobacterium sp. xm-a-121]|uniref:TetR/AcrR family transcriptional regulator n=1 Tax=unclassified Marinobacterium TaxID=2644139 RepID=UPI001569DB78|nr:MULTISPECIES: TetR/AcrR family transcriptional regulator [unclassified Marinobacterium]NRP38750.1 HTH-type transcriptional regulator AcrR [Marinobacterium sp. xm-a-121]NRP99566.1 HTH-type transcriptional regulator AcrR [Marinobacterium sp. xm-v-233]